MNKKLYDLIINSEMGKQLFNFSEVPTDVSLWTAGEEYNGITWLYASTEQKYSLIGAYEDGEICAIDDEGYFVEVCNGLENIPYEMLRIWTGFTNNENINDIFLVRPDIKELLIQYEQWCKDNNIELDKDKIYHDENGNLFVKYFDKD